MLNTLKLSFVLLLLGGSTPLLAQQSAHTVPSNEITITWSEGQSHERVNINVRGKGEVEVIAELVDALGQTVMETIATYPQGDGKLSVAPGTLEPGLYFVRVSTDEGLIERETIILE